MPAPHIVALDHHAPAVAERIHAVQRLAYAQEAALLGVKHFAPLDVTAAVIRSSRERFFGAVAGNNLVGVVSLGSDTGPSQCDIASLVVLPTHQRSGIARRLLAAALHECRGASVTVSTGAKNDPALALYAEFGFVECERRSVGSEALELVKLRRPCSNLPATAVLREATMADAHAIFDVHCDAVHKLCVDTYTEAQLQAWFEGRTPEMYRPALEAGRVWLAERGGRVLGFVGFAAGEVTLLFVRHEAAGSGLGKRLLALGIERAEADFSGPLTVIATLNSRRFYEAHGFAAVETQTVIRGQPALHLEVVMMQRPPRPTLPIGRTGLETAV